jgi:DNA-binding response OmpR family regulator
MDSVASPTHPSPTLLIMDDDPMVRRVTVAMLQRAGYACETARDGEEAVERFKAAQAERRPFDAVILDLTIRGGMGGRDTLELLRRLDPEVPALALSGLGDTATLVEVGGGAFDERLTKPFTTTDLVTAVQAILGRRRLPNQQN